MKIAVVPNLDQRGCPNLHRRGAVHFGPLRLRNRAEDRLVHRPRHLPGAGGRLPGLRCVFIAIGGDGTIIPPPSWQLPGAPFWA